MRAASLVCPKCAGAMRTYERSGVVIDQCEDCRGVYLDRGELERLITAEEQAYQTPPPPAADRDSDYSSSGHGSGHGGSRHESSSGSTKRRRGFLGDLFD
ncbi:MAG: TFIIB-type zinc ribbon-containing protein [Candidatus Nanopelagicales bacterium]